MSQFIEMFEGIQNDSKWPLKSLEELCDMVNGYAFKSNKYSDAGYSIIRIANVQKGTIDDSDKVYYPESYRSEYSDSILKEGDILVSLTGNVGRVGVIYNKHLPAALNQRVQGLRIKNTSLLNPQYLFSLLNLDDFENLCIKNASGSAQLNLSTVWLRNCKIVCPPIEKQEQFALIAQQADKSKFVGFKSQFIEMFGGVEEKKSLCVISRPRQWPTIQTKDFTTNGYFVYGANGIIGKYSSYNHEDETLTIACRGASCGAINLTSRQSYITGNAMSIDELSNEVKLKYLQHFLLYYDFSSIITGGAQPQITYANLSKVEVPIPPISLQNEFIAIAQQADKSKLV